MLGFSYLYLKAFKSYGYFCLYEHFYVTPPQRECDVSQAQCSCSLETHSSRPIIQPGFLIYQDSP